MTPSGLLFAPSRPLYVCVHVCVSQSCDEGTHRDRKNLCGRAAVNSAGEKRQ